MPEEQKEQTKEKSEISEELSELLRVNLDKNEEILKISRKLDTYLKWQNVWGILRLLVILVPIILGFIYLPPIIKEFFQSYQSLIKFN